MSHKLAFGIIVEEMTIDMVTFKEEYPYVMKNLYSYLEIGVTTIGNCLASIQAEYVSTEAHQNLVFDSPLVVILITKALLFNFSRLLPLGFEGLL